MTRQETLSPANMLESPPIKLETEEDTQAAAASFESHNSQQEDDTFVPNPGTEDSVPRDMQAKCLCYSQYSLYDLARDLVVFYPIYITFCFFWVQGTAHSLEYPFLRQMRGEYDPPSYPYAAVMSIFTAVVLHKRALWKKVSSANPATRWELNRFIVFGIPKRWALIRFFVIGLHIATPFVVGSIILHAEYDQACNDYAFTLASSRGGGLESGSHTLGAYYMSSEQNRTLRLGFNVSQGDGINDDVSVNLSTSYELVFDGSGDGHLRMDCGEVPRCVTGKLHLRHNSLEGEIQYLGGKPKAVKLSTVWWGNPMAISIDGQYALETAEVPTTDEVKICANDLHVAIIGGSFVSLLQEHVESCRQCFNGCRGACRSGAGRGSRCSLPVCFKKCTAECTGVAADSLHHYSQFT
jgi:hypothetical protein